MKYDIIAVVSSNFHLTYWFKSALYSLDPYYIGFIRQNRINIILELSNLPINGRLSVIVFCNSTQSIARSRLCLSRSVIPIKCQFKMSVTVWKVRIATPVHFNTHFRSCFTKYIRKYGWNFRDLIHVNFWSFRIILLSRILFSSIV